MTPTAHPNVRPEPTALERLALLEALLRQFAPARLTSSDIETTLRWPSGEVSRLCRDRRVGLGVHPEGAVRVCRAESSHSRELELWLDERRASGPDDDQRPR